MYLGNTPSYNSISNKPQRIDIWCSICDLSTFSTYSLYPFFLRCCFYIIYYSAPLLYVLYNPGAEKVFVISTRRINIVSKRRHIEPNSANLHIRGKNEVRISYGELGKVANKCFPYNLLTFFVRTKMASAQSGVVAHQLPLEIQCFKPPTFSYVSEQVNGSSRL